jgi:hypothetical protein
MLPDATTGSISYVDALFTATSAVCVTGLNVLDTELSFTLLGQSIILLLIQVGGLGIMTFTTYFSYFFKGASSYKNQLLVKDITNDERLDNVFSSLKSILLITVVIEGLGFALVFLSLDIKDISLPERVFVMPASPRCQAICMTCAFVSIIRCTSLSLRLSYLGDWDFPSYTTFGNIPQPTSAIFSKEFSGMKNIPIHRWCSMSIHILY